MFEPGSGVAIPLGTILPTAIGAGALMMGLAYLAFQAHKRKKASGEATLVGHKGRVIRIKENSQEGQVEVSGEIWNYETKSELQPGDQVLVTSVDGLTLEVQKI